MKKLLLAIAGAALSAGAAMADETLYTCLFGPDYNQQAVNNYTTVWQTANDGMTWNIGYFNNNNNGWEFIRGGRKSDPTDAFISTATAMAGNISEIVLSYNKWNASYVTSLTLLVADNADFSNATEIAIENPTSASGELVFQIDNPSDNHYYKISLPTVAGGSNGFVEISKIEYKGTAGTASELKNPELKWMSNGEAVSKFAAGYGNWMALPRLDNPNRLPVTYTSSNEKVVTAEEYPDLWFDMDKYDKQEYGKTTITATFAGNDEYSAQSVSFDLYVGKTVESFEMIYSDYENGDIDSNSVLWLSNAYVLVYQNGSSNYIASGFDQEAERMLVYGNMDYEAGDVIWGLFATFTYYNSLPELKTIGDFANGSLAGTVADYDMEIVYPEVAVADLESWMNGVVTVKNVTFETETPASKKTVNGKCGDEELAFYNTFGVDVMEAGTYDVVCAVATYKGNLQVYPISYTVSTQTGVEAVAAAGEAQYFNLQGVRVANPENGICIRVQNGRAEKIVK